MHIKANLSNFAVSISNALNKIKYLNFIVKKLSNAYTFWVMAGSLIMSETLQ